MSRPRPADYPTAFSYLVAKREWQKSRGSYLTTLFFALLLGGLIGSPVVTVLFLGIAVVGVAARRQELRKRESRGP